MFLTGRSPDQVLPAASGLGADLKVEPPSPDSLARLPDLGPDLVIADAAEDPARTHELLGVLSSAGSDLPVLAVVGRDDLGRFDWAAVADEFVFVEASHAELQLRLDMLTARRGAAGHTVIRLGAVAIDVETYQVTVGGRVLDLTFKEFELLRYLAGHPGRVFSRANLLQEVWGYDFYGGTRTVDVHVRRLRAKLGPEHEHLVETVRGVGYRAAEPRGERVP